MLERSDWIWTSRVVSARSISSEYRGPPSVPQEVVELLFLCSLPAIRPPARQWSPGSPLLLVFRPVGVDVVSIVMVVIAGSFRVVRKYKRVVRPLASLRVAYARILRCFTTLLVTLSISSSYVRAFPFPLASAEVTYY
jgi:hypothetical protein